MQLLVVADSRPLALAPAVRAEIRALDPTGPITEVSTVEAELGESLAVRRFQAQLLSLFSSLALLLAAVGIFGLMTQLVTRRTEEIGVRMAVGAAPNDVLRMVLRQGLLLVAAGGVVGTAGALIIARLLKSLLYGVSAGDLLSYAAAAAVMALTAAIACAIPAWRAAHLDPMAALRNDG
jgi:ABC-type antimicrobial peptide transport system permease subunit